MRQFKIEERQRAIRRGLEFIYEIACDEEHFAAWGHDLLNCFYFISATSLDPALRRTARKMGRERALKWRREHSTLPRVANAETISEYIHGIYAAERLGLRDSAIKKQLLEAAKRITAREYLYFDPATEPPPSDATEICWCGFLNERGRKTCRECRRRLVVINRYKLWYDALIAAYNCERVGVHVGARFVEVLKWLPAMRPYLGRENGDNPDFYDTLYAITHIVYTLNDYSLYRLSPRWLPHEYEFLKTNLREAIEMEDPDMMGEFLDSLKAFGLEDSHPLIRTGMEFLLSRQNEDGSWGDMNAEDIYERYHPTWTAIDGLRQYAWRGERLSFPRLMTMLQAMNRQHR
ncbi:MAG: hypothetical protein QOJ02_44 [Acidobacteriota bacterium]|jgi:hypothetical protein|nr:hypothetical protein [Acidobacteriota bacterium]